MKAELISRSIHHDCSFTLECHSYKSFLKKWHYHPQLELVIILESTGTRFVGDSIEKFNPGEIVLLGRSLPHLWLNDKPYFENDSDLKVKAFVIHFSEEFSNHFTSVPELHSIKHLFQRAKRGIRFDGGQNESIIDKVGQMFGMNDFNKVLTLLSILNALSEHSQAKLLSSSGFLNTFKASQNSKLVCIYEYIMTNFKNEITLDQIADLAHMNPSAFSRYFKSVQKKTFTQFLNEVRIGYACKLLQEQRYNIAEVCFESGYNNISNFNRQFKALKQMSPSAYVKMYTQLEYN